jgi:hypothetical protein
MLEAPAQVKNQSATVEPANCPDDFVPGQHPWIASYAPGMQNL